MNMQKPKNLPTSPGVYLFRDRSGRALYIGKAGNLKARLSFYFRKDARHQPRTSRLLDEASRISLIKTESEIEALVKEAELIKTFHPKYNILLRDDKNYLFVVITREYFPRLILTHQPKSFSGTLKAIGPFTDASAVRTTLKLLRKVFPYCTCQNPHRGLCLNAEIGKCPGPCCAKPMSKKKYRAVRQIRNDYLKNIRAISSILEGKKIRALQKETKKELAAASRALAYERAARLRDELAGLEEIFLHRTVVNRHTFNDEGAWLELAEKIKSMLKTDSHLSRVEGYDISNISGTEASGSMIVFTDGLPEKNEYRKFRIKTVSGANDAAMLAEVIGRRFQHREWPFPDLIILDGGKPQLNAVIKTLHDEKQKTHALITALAKRDEELYVAGRSGPLQLKTRPRDILHFFQRVRDEAHRFAKRYHHKLRELGFNKVT